MPLDSDPCYGWDKEKYAVPPKLRIPLSEWPALFEACQTPLETITLSSGLFLFLRGSEQQRIQMKHVHLDDLEIEVYRVKVKEWDIMPIPEELDPYLRNHLTHMTELGFVDKNHYLIYAMSQARAVKGTFGIAKNSNVPNPIKANGRPFKIVQGILERAGYPTYREGEHTLRRSAARAYFDSLVSQGYDGALRRVMSMLGHKDSKTTEEYLGLELDRLQRNADLKGKPMFPSVRNASIIPITRGRSGD